MGAKVEEAPWDDDAVLTHTFDLAEAAELRDNWVVFRDRRPDLYGPLTSLDGRRTGGGGARRGSVEAAKQREELGGTAAHLRLETRMMAGIAGAPGRPHFRRRLVDDDLPAAVEGELHPIARPHSQRLADLPGTRDPSLGAYSCCHRVALADWAASLFPP